MSRHSEINYKAYGTQQINLRFCSTLIYSTTIAFIRSISKSIKGCVGTKHIPVIMGSTRNDLPLSKTELDFSTAYV